MGSSFKGIGFMCLGVLCLALGDAISKWLGEVHSPLQIIFFRTLVSLPLIMLLAHQGGGLRTLSTRRPGVHLIRGLIYTGTMGCFVLGLTMMPLAEGTAIAFAAPLFVSLLSVPLLGERVSVPVVLASLVGFAGVLVIVRPGSEGISLGALSMLGAAVFYALMMITARRYGAREHLWAMVFYMTLVPFVVTGVALPLVWQAPALEHWPAFLMSGVLGVGATAFITLAFRHAPAAIAAPFDYTAMLWAVLLGWMIWDEVPDLGVLIGGTLIIASGLAIAYQEGRTSLKRRPSA
ncbi:MULTISPECIES: DMT family transporter [Halomonas]|uniref:DMT family transporter n=2 Tax=Halomonas TaxID=2745 RepID=A0AAU7KGM8_9GAMM|nr:MULTISPECIES: DMT family transporter [Halomonas]MBR9772419.1 DMT family transporter [Gammaproteobacteria bacterium]KJZ10539.1 S-adenosylmethionine uptake transporter [Halomonas sp. S2151]MAR73571.1 EamA/RhaT family transporter [Halomonas sp.]MBR9880389.1 DMT family transporter [Gammaproteobacteria bacterium]MBS8269555.1 DMT family transporter [Halomonas litopenaei]|tara:strand:- start:133 stop:1008 length:876 start_codon:yes stop_codon:yes gene_type:complete